MRKMRRQAHRFLAFWNRFMWSTSQKNETNNNYNLWLHLNKIELTVLLLCWFQFFVEPPQKVKELMDMMPDLNKSRPFFCLNHGETWSTGDRAGGPDKEREFMKYKPRSWRKWGDWVLSCCLGELVKSKSSDTYLLINYRLLPIWVQVHG